MNGAYAIPCNIIISAEDREHASHAALVMLREVIGTQVFDPEEGTSAECIGFDSEEEMKMEDRQ